jgi:hypothetical protein
MLAKERSFERLTLVQDLTPTKMSSGPEGGNFKSLQCDHTFAGQSRTQERKKSHKIAHRDKKAARGGGGE